MSASKIAATQGNQAHNVDQGLWEILLAGANLNLQGEAVVSYWQTKGSEPGSKLRWTFSELLVLTDRLATGISTFHNYSEQGIMLCVLGNSAQWVLCLWTAARLNIPFCCVDPRSSGSELLAYIRATSPTILIVDTESTADRVSEFSGSDLASVSMYACVDESALFSTAQKWKPLNDLLQAERDTIANLPYVSNPSAMAIIVFTSGTTSKPKGCTHSGRSICAQTNSWDDGLNTRDLICMPVSHMTALNNSLRSWRFGGCTIFPSERFDPGATIEVIDAESCTRLTAVPPLIHALVTSSKFHAYSGVSLNIVYIVGMKTSQECLRTCRESLKASYAFEIYGMSECGPAAAWRISDSEQRCHTIGAGFTGDCAKLRIFFPASHAVMGRNEVGDLHVGGSILSPAYLQQEGAAQFYDDDEGRWLITGDRGYIDDDSILHLSGRHQDVVIRGGENISTASIEDQINQISLESTVLGIFDETAGEVPVAVISFSKTQLLQRLKNWSLSKCPHSIFTLEELGYLDFPRTRSGKIQKNLLADAIVHRKMPEASVVTLAISGLGDLMLNLWKSLIGYDVDITDPIDSFADSITILTFCDKLVRQGKHLYFEDFHPGDSTKSIEELLVRRISSCQTNQVSKLTYPHDLMASVSAALMVQGLRVADVEMLTPVKYLFKYFVDGLRPQSYHHREAFRISSRTVEQVRTAMEKLIRAHATLRAFAVKLPDGSYTHAVIKSSHPLYAKLIKVRHVLGATEALAVVEDCSAWRFPSSQMFEFMIIEDSHCNIVVTFTFNHSIFDAISVIKWYRDMEQLLIRPSSSLAKTTPFQLFAELLEATATTSDAAKSLDFHISRLRGIASLKPALWPIQKAPGWMVAYDADANCFAEREKSRRNIGSSTETVPRRMALIQSKFFQTLKLVHNLTPAIVMLASVCLLNVFKTCQDHAILSVVDSGRKWPFLSQGLEDFLPALSTIDGPTIQWLLNIIIILKSETVLQFLIRMREEQSEISNHVHAPWNEILGRLDHESAVAESALMRQTFNWDITVGLRKSAEVSSSLMTLAGRWDWPDSGVVWNCGPVNLDTVGIIVVWDTAQLAETEIESCLESLQRIASWMTDENNLYLPIEQLFQQL